MQKKLYELDISSVIESDTGLNQTGLKCEF